VSNWVEYVARLLGDEQQVVTAQRLGVNQGTISRWRTGKKVPTDAALIAAFAAEYGRNPVEAFVAAGALSWEVAKDALDADSRRLLAEIGVEGARGGKGRSSSAS